ncbi:hypothetical protein CDAR_43271 [Caerostris darwini]|uniref:LAGLIDADG homing endonuclease n=1 Tax=Caerostris darwini TaxID=1538125 RepID=A0AAV4WGC5_9ARAC|nr:hypothetical protein CDAR_43271 [Caerostris darwini]
MKTKLFPTSLGIYDVLRFERTKEREQEIRSHQNCISKSGGFNRKYLLFMGIVDFIWDINGSDVQCGTRKYLAKEVLKEYKSYFRVMAI